MLMPTVFHENLFDDFFDPFWNDAALERAMNREARGAFGKRGANMMPVFEPHAPVEESVQLVVHFGSHLQQGFFQVVECGERVVENLLFERRFAYDGFEDFLSQGYAFLAISKD